MDAVLSPTDNRGRAVAGDARFRPAWGFKGDAIEVIAGIIRDVDGPVIHACCGAATIPGETIRVDLYHPRGQPIDVQDLDLHFQDAAAIVIDPPYGKKEWPLDVRQRAMSACWRALRPGGLLIVHAPWQPRFAADWLVLQEPIYMREDHRLSFPTSPVLICTYQKTRDPTIIGPTRNGKRVQARARKRQRKGGSA